MSTAVPSDLTHAALARNPISYLEVFQPHVLETREQFLGQLKEELPAQSRDIAVAAFHQRRARHESLPMFAEYLPWLCAEALGLEDDEATRHVAIAWLHLYTSVVMLDEAIDGERTSKAAAPELLVSTLLFERGMSRMCELRGVDSELRQTLDASYAKTIEAHVDPPHEFRELGRKIAGIRMPIEMLIAMSGRTDLAPWLRNVTDYICLSGQVLDDVTDFEQDYRAGIVTPLLRRMTVSLPRKADRNELLVLLAESGALEAALEAAHDAVAHSCELLDTQSEGSASTLRAYLGAALTRVERARCNISRTRAEKVGANLREYVKRIDRSLDGIYLQH